VIDELIGRADIVDIIGDKIPLKKMGKNYFANCVFHEEKSASLSVNPQDQLYYCHGCGAAGNVINFIMEYENKSFPDAVKALAKSVNYTLPTKDHENKKDGTQSVLGILAHAAKIYSDQLSDNKNKTVNNLLADRGVSQESIVKFGLGAAMDGWNTLGNALGGYKKADLLSEAGLSVYKKKTDSEKGRFYDRFRNSLIFPVRSESGAVLTFAQRRLDDESSAPKYINGIETKVFKKSNVLYGLYETLKHDRRPSSIIVAEGYMDVITAHQHGLTSTVATMGTSIQAQSIEKLLRHTDHIVFCFDGDKAGTRAAQRALHQSLPYLAPDKQINFIFMPQGEDMDSYLAQHGADSFRDHIMQKRLRPASSFLLHMAKEGCQDMNTIEQRSRFYKQSVDMIELIPPSPYKAALMQEIEHISHIKPKEYLPLSIKLNDKALATTNISQLEVKIKDYIAETESINRNDIMLSVCPPEIRQKKRPQTVSYPLNGTSLDAVMNNVNRILEMDNVFIGELTLRQLLITSTSGEPMKRSMAKTMLRQHFENSDTHKVEVSVIVNELKTIESSLAGFTGEEESNGMRSQVIENFVAQCNGNLVGYEHMLQYSGEDEHHGIQKNIAEAKACLASISQHAEHTSAVSPIKAILTQ